MKRFVFPLETARTLRFRQLELEEAALQRLLAEREAIAARDRALECELRDEEKLLTAPRMASEQLAALDGFRKFTAVSKQRLAREMHGCDQRIAQQRLRMLEARRRFRLLEQLRDKKLSQWTAEQAREQEQLAADLYLARCARER